MYSREEIERNAPLYGEYGLYSDFVLSEDMRSADDDYADEQWAEVKEDSNYYVSTKGRIWSTITNTILKTYPHKNGYPMVSIKNKNGVYRKHCIHRLMGNAFFNNIDGSLLVRHLDDDPENNIIENLALGTQSDNMYDCVKNGHRKNMVKTIAINTRTGEETVYESLKDAVRATGVQQPNAWEVMNGKRKQTGGYVFRRAE